MKTKSKVLAVLAATGLIVAPAAAQSLRASAPVTGEAFGGEGEGGSAAIIAAALIAGIAAIAALAFTGSDDDEGVSP